MKSTTKKKTTTSNLRQKTTTTTSNVRQQTHSRWSSDRPKRPDFDPMLAELRQLLERDKRTDYAKANASGLAPSTLAHIERGETRRPQGVTMQMAYAMLGYKLVAVPK